MCLYLTLQRIFQFIKINYSCHFVSFFTSLTTYCLCLEEIKKSFKLKINNKMGLFSDFLKGSDEVEKPSKIRWIYLTENGHIEEIILQSTTKPVLIFKHSTRCGVSRMALKNFERDYDIDKTDLELYFLDILKYRELSNEVSEKFGVHHQSPQVLLIKNKSVIYHDSHYQISVETVKEALLK